MILSPIYTITLTFIIGATSCIIADEPNNPVDPLLGMEFDATQNVYTFMPLNYDDPKLNASIQRSVIFWTPWATTSDNKLIKTLDSQYAEVIPELNITVTVAELDKSSNEIRFALIVLQHSHLQYVAGLTTLDTAILEKAKYIENAAERVKIPIWESCKGYVQQPVDGYNEEAVMKWITNKGYVITNIWSCAYSEFTRYIIILRHKKATEMHSHYRFLSVTVVNGTATINAAGGHMRTPQLAEVSAAIFLTLDFSYTTATWNDDAKVTWRYKNTSLEELNLGNISSAGIMDAIIDLIPAGIRFYPGLTEPLQIEFRDGYYPMGLPCPNRKSAEKFLCQTVVHHTWLQAVVMDKLSRMHVVGFTLEYQNGICTKILDSAYLGYMTEEDYYKAFNETSTQNASIQVENVPETVAPPLDQSPARLTRQGSVKRFLVKKTNSFKNLLRTSSSKI